MSGAAGSCWPAEVERLRESSGTLGPAARSAVQAVLESVVAEPGVEPEVASSARALLAALGAEHRRSPPAGGQHASPDSPLGGVVDSSRDRPGVSGRAARARPILHRHLGLLPGARRLGVG